MGAPAWFEEFDAPATAAAVGPGAYGGGGGGGGAGGAGGGVAGGMPAGAGAAGGGAGGPGGAGPSLGGGGDPMFKLERVEFRPDAEIVALEVASNKMVMALANNHLIRLNLNAAADLEDVEVAPKLKEGVDRIRALFLDPSGTHLLISMSNGTTYYLHETWQKPRLLPKMRGVDVTAVAWNRAQQDGQNTREILVGTSSGKIFVTSIEANNDRAFVERLVGGAAKDRSEFTLVRTLDEDTPVTGLRFESFPGGKQLWIMACTRIRIYEFIGGPTLEGVFQAHEGTMPRFHELAGDLPSSTMEFFVRAGRPGSRTPVLPSTFAWMTEPGVYFGELDFDPRARTGDTCVPKPHFQPYDAMLESPGAAGAAAAAAAAAGGVPPAPLALAVTEFHYLLLFNDTLVAVNVINHEPVWRETFAANTMFGALRGMARDPLEQTLWLFADWGVFEIPIVREDRRVWELYLEQRKYEDAIAFATTPAQKDRVRTAQADNAFASGDYQLAAQHYGATGRSFEEITLKFIGLGDQSALKAYLLSKLRFIKTASSGGGAGGGRRGGAGGGGGGDATQVTLIATWLCELYLDELNHAQDELSAAMQAARSSSSSSSSAAQQQEGRTTRSRASAVAPGAAGSGGTDLGARLASLTADFHGFLSGYRRHLDKNTTFHLMTSHGHTASVLFFAQLTGEIDRVMQHLLQHEDYAAALDAMQQPVDADDAARRRSAATASAGRADAAEAGAPGAGAEIDAEVFYRYSPQLVHALPRATVDAWIAAGPALDPARLIPALMRYEETGDANSNATVVGARRPTAAAAGAPQQQQNPATAAAVSNEAIRYLQYVVTDLGNRDQAIHNYLLSLYAKRKPSRGQVHDAFAARAERVWAAVCGEAGVKDPRGPDADREDLLRQYALRATDDQPAQLQLLATAAGVSRPSDLAEWARSSSSSASSTGWGVVRARLAALVRRPTAAEQNAQLLAFLRAEPRYYDLKYALRVCTEQDRPAACVRIYNLMGLYEEATDLALACGDLEEAQAQPRSCGDDDFGALKKKLWLKIARYVVEQNDISRAMELLQTTEGLLKIEDILPFFPDFTNIDRFKTEICSSLEDYNRHIQQLKDEMEEATNAAEAIRGDISRIRDKYGFVAAGQRCALCSYPVLTQVFYLFPCQHVAHVECQFREIAPHLDGPQAARVLELVDTLGIPVDRMPRRLPGGGRRPSTAAVLRRAAASVEAAARERQRQLAQQQRGAAGAAAAAAAAADASSSGAAGGTAASSLAQKLSFVSSKFGGAAALGAGAGAGADGAGGPGAGAAQAQAAAAALDQLREDLDDIVSSDCLLCGDAAIELSSLPFVTRAESAIVRGWAVDDV